MSYEAELATLTQRFSAQFTASQPTVAIAWPNTSYKPTTGVPWVRFSIQQAPAEQIGFGSSVVRDRHFGTIFIQVFVPLESAVQTAMQIADDAAAAMRRYYTTGLLTRTASVHTIGPTGDGWYQVNVSIPYQRDTDF